MARILKLNPRNGDSPSDPSSRSAARKRVAAFGAWAVLAIVFVAVVASVSPTVFVPQTRYRHGGIWEGPAVAAPFAITVVDKSAADLIQAELEQRHEKVFEYDTQALPESQVRLDQLLKVISSDTAATTSTDLRKQVAGETGLSLSRQTIATLAAGGSTQRVRSDLRQLLDHFYGIQGLASMPDKTLLQAAARQRRLVMEATGTALVPGTTSTAEKVLGYPDEAMAYLESVFLPKFALSKESAAAYAEVARQILRPNISFNRGHTNLRLEQAMKRLLPRITVNPGDVIVQRGQPVTGPTAWLLEELNRQQRTHNFVHAAGNAVVLGIAILFLAFYVRRFSPEFSFTSRDVLLLALPAITALCIGRFFINISPTADVMPFAFPAGMLGMLSIILFGTPLALMLVVVTSLTVGLTATSIGQGFSPGLDYSFVLASLVGGFTGVASLAAMKERRQVLLAGVWVALANMVTLVALALIRDPKLLNTTNLIACAANGIGCYVLTLGALPLFETLFGLSTDVRLMELTSTQHPLLRMMEEKAPGTFQHTLNVAKLAESAAEGVGANFLLVRAGAYFHDIGKMLHPKYFTENQTTPDERRTHSRLSPYMSTLIVKNHVKEGIELAQEHRLPDRVVDFIPQHHGTSLIKYFYAQALEKAEPNEIVLEDEFRYPGPKPQTIEAAIVMVADSIDAIATAKLSGRTVREEDIQRLVRDTITEKFRDGQFDECHMTFRDMHLMTEALVRALLSRYHQRVDYPTIPQAREIRDITRPGSAEAVGAGK